MRAPVTHISLQDRIQQVDPAKVRGLAESMTEIGLLHPIVVNRTTVSRQGVLEPGYVLISGAHRLEAAKSLGWTEIDVTLSDLSGWHAILAECDENLCGSHLTPSARALFTRKRKEAYEALHPETAYDARPGRGGKCRQIGDNSAPAERFTADTAARTGQSERVVQRDAERGEKIAPEVLQEIQGTDLDKGVVLDRLAKQPSAEAQLAAIRREQDAAEAHRRNRQSDRNIALSEAASFADWLMARTDLNELPQIISWLEGCKPRDVIAALRREAA